MPLEDIGAVIISHPAVRLTHAAISELCEHNAGLIVCNRRHMPTGMMMPMAANYIQTARMMAQSELTEPAKKGLWRIIVKAKIRAQANVLKTFYGNDSGLFDLSKKVKSGDPDNIEARASRLYWPRLFGDDFRRTPQGGDTLNGFLNYGYAVVRSMMTRAICGGGLNPTLGLHHHNRYNPFCLADDLMEPYRTVVDAVALCLRRGGQDQDLSLNREGKQALISGIINFRCRDGRLSRDLFSSFTSLVSSLVDYIMGEKKTLKMPVPLHEKEKEK